MTMGRPSGSSSWTSDFSPSGQDGKGVRGKQSVTYFPFLSKHSPFSKLSSVGVGITKDLGNREQIR